MPKVVFDIDCIIFDAVSVMQETYIEATHKPSGQVIELENRTQLWGHYKNKGSSGWIKEQNDFSQNDYYKPEDFEVVDCVRPRGFRQKTGPETPDIILSPEEGAKKIIDDKIRVILGKLNASEYFGYTGKGEVFRHDKATLMPYKGQRADLIVPLLRDKMKEYVIENHNIKLVEGIEADDAVSMATVAAYRNWKSSGSDDDIVIAVAVDKDAKQTEGWHFNPTKDESPRLIEGFGKLWLTEKGDVDGKGRMWLYYQTLAGDETDHYKSNCFSTVKFASKGAYNALKDATTDKEALQALVDTFKKLYPEKKTVTTFRGDIEIDWLYVASEMFTLARMLRWDGDVVILEDVLKKLGVEY